MTIQPFDKHKISHIRGVDHPESIGLGPDGNFFTTGTGCQVYRVDVADNTVRQFATTAERCLGSVVDADGNLYAAHAGGGDVLRITMEGQVTTYATGPGGEKFLCPNYPAFDNEGRMYLSDSGTWERKVDGRIYRIAPGGGEASLWYSEPVDTPNAIALDADQTNLYFVETFGHAISRIGINADGSAGPLERVVHMPRAIPDGIAFDVAGRLWIACHRPDAIYVLDPQTGQLELFCEDWEGEALRGPTDVAFAGPQRDILFAASLDNLCLHRFDNVGVIGLSLNHPKIDS